VHGQCAAFFITHFMNHFKNYLLTYFKGMGMGGADLVPGVSGGSIALITGIYEELLDSIKSVDAEAARLVFKGQFKAFWQHVNGAFLLAVFLGIFTTIFTLSRLLTYLIEFHPIPLWSFFCGLILISAIWILKDIRRWSVMVIVGLVLGIVVAYLITSLPPMTSPDAALYTFISGAIAICAMILPGISGSFILLILGQYEPILEAVNNRDVFKLGLFAIGCVVGLLTFSRLISWLLKHYKAITLAVLSGFMLGSINKIWPWKKVLSYRMSSSGEEKPFITENIWPQDYMHFTGQEPQLGLAFVAFAIGFFIVIGLEQTAKMINNK
jgi:putative membrane protein